MCDLHSEFDHPVWRQVGIVSWIFSIVLKDHEPMILPAWQSLIRTRARNIAAKDLSD